MSVRSGCPGRAGASWPTMSSSARRPQAGGQRRPLGEALLGGRGEQVVALAGPTCHPGRGYDPAASRDGRGRPRPRIRRSANGDAVAGDLASTEPAPTRGSTSDEVVLVLRRRPSSRPPSDAPRPAWSRRRPPAGGRAGGEPRRPPRSARPSPSCASRCADPRDHASGVATSRGPASRAGQVADRALIDRQPRPCAPRIRPAPAHADVRAAPPDRRPVAAPPPGGPDRHACAAACDLAGAIKHDGLTRSTSRGDARRRAHAGAGRGRAREQPRRRRYRAVPRPGSPSTVRTRTDGARRREAGLGRSRPLPGRCRWWRRRACAGRSALRRAGATRGRGHRPDRIDRRRRGSATSGRRVAVGIAVAHDAHVRARRRPARHRSCRSRRRRTRRHRPRRAR